MSVSYTHLDVYKRQHLIGGQTVLAQHIGCLAGLAELVVHTDLMEFAVDLAHRCV